MLARALVSILFFLYLIMEKWKKIKGYEGYYMISNYGNIKSESRQVRYSNGRIVNYKSKIRKPSVSEYRLIALSKNGNTKMFKISRLVASHFLKAKKDKNVVNHIDGNKHNDFHKNLEWCTTSDNNIHAFESGLSNKKNKVSGVFYEKRRGKWAAYLYRNNKNVFVGRFSDYSEAVYARNIILLDYE